MVSGQIGSSHASHGYTFICSTDLFQLIKIRDSSLELRPLLTKCDVDDSTIESNRCYTPYKVVGSAACCCKLYWSNHSRNCATCCQNLPIHRRHKSFNADFHASGSKQHGNCAHAQKKGCSIELFVHMQENAWNWSKLVVCNVHSQASGM
jgi:hypothetical protein